jgi:hypothetical protein
MVLRAGLDAVREKKNLLLLPGIEHNKLLLLKILVTRGRAGFCIDL